MNVNNPFIVATSFRVGLEVDDLPLEPEGSLPSAGGELLTTVAKFDFLKPSNSREQSGLMVQEESKTYLAAKRHKKLRKANKT